MKKILFAIVAILLISTSCEKKPNFDKTLLYGVWVSGSYHEKYLSTGSGYFWDTSEDVNESEAQTFTWEIEEDLLTLYKQHELGTAVSPELFTITTLTETTLIYEANGKTYSYKKQ